MKGDYANGRIYKIEPICEHDENEVYYGSTCQILCKRMDSHRNNYKCWLNGKRYKTSSFELFEKYGVENCKIYLVELYPCETKEELFAREGYYIKTNMCVNKYVAGRTLQQYKIDLRDELNEKLKKYVLENKEKIQEYKNKYRRNNKEFIAELNSIYRDNNKDKLSTKYNCECGGKYTYENKHKHIKSIKHIKWQKEKEIEEVVDV